MYPLGVYSISVANCNCAACWSGGSCSSGCSCGSRYRRSRCRRGGAIGAFFVTMLFHYTVFGPSASLIFMRCQQSVHARRGMAAQQQRSGCGMGVMSKDGQQGESHAVSGTCLPENTKSSSGIL